MNWAWLLIGTALVLTALVDAIAHTLVMNGSGPLARRLGRGTWSALLAVRDASGWRGLEVIAGPLILLLTFALWSTLLWAGWSLIFAADPTGVVSASSGAPGSGLDRLYFAGFVLTTLGMGDYRPSSALYKVLTPWRAASGSSSSPWRSPTSWPSSAPWWRNVPSPSESWSTGVPPKRG